jgi:hypothetical protein
LPEPVAFLISTHVRNDINCQLLHDGISSFLGTWLNQTKGDIEARLRPFHMYVSDNGSPRGERISGNTKVVNEQLALNASHHYDSRPCFRNVSQRFPRILTVDRQPGYTEKNISAYEAGAMLLAWRLPRAEYLYYASNSTLVSDAARTGNIPALEVSSLRLSLQDMANRGSGQLVQLHHSMNMRQFIPPSHTVRCKFSPMMPRAPFFYDTKRTPPIENVEQHSYAAKAGRAMGMPLKFYSPSDRTLKSRVSAVVAHNAFFASFNKSLPVSNNSTLSMLSYIDLLLKLEQRKSMPDRMTHDMAWERLNACIFSWFGMNVQKCAVGGTKKIHGGNHDH